MIESKEIPNEFISIRQVWLRQIDRCNEAFSKRYMMDVRDDRSDRVGQQMVAETVMALHSNLIDFGEATIKTDVDAWRKERWSTGTSNESRKVVKSYIELFEFIIQTLNRYGMLFDSQPRGFSNVVMRSIECSPSSIMLSQ